MGIGSLSLLDYRRKVADHYRAVRQGQAPISQRWQQWCLQRDQLFTYHPQTPLSERDRHRFGGLNYFEYDPSWRFQVHLEPIEEANDLAVELKQDGLLALHRLGRIHFQVEGEDAALTVYWLDNYGGGIFLPFRDGSNGKMTYGGGRYLLDTIKGADLGGDTDQLFIDFNFAYNPSCAYDPRWHCPLAPPENWLDIHINAGELDFQGVEKRKLDRSAIPREI